MANQAPAVSFGTLPKIVEGQPNAVSFLSFLDADAGSSTVLVTLAVTSGTLAATAQPGVNVSGSGTASLTLQGTLADINAYLAGSKATVSPVADSVAQFRFTATINDADATDPQSASQGVDITPAANGAPTGLKLASPFNPSVTVIAVAENAAAGTVVGNLSATDPEGSAVTYSLASGGNGLFVVDGSQVKLAQALGDYETAAQKSYTIKVEARDAYGNVSSKDFTIQHADAYDAPEGRLTLDASGSTGGMNFGTFIAGYFQGLAGPTYEFYGGSTVPVYGNINGEQIVYSYKKDGVAQANRVVLEGTDLGYDGGNYGFAAGHGFSGSLDNLSFGQFVQGVTTGTPGTGDAGLLKDLATQLKITGLDLDVAVGTGHVSQVNLIYALHKAVEGGNATAIYAALSNYAQDFKGSAGNDTFTGGSFGDTFAGKGGTDTFDGGAGADTLRLSGDRGSYTVTANADGSVTLADARAGGDGTVTASNTEAFAFRDGEQTLDELSQPLAAGRITIDASGSDAMSFESFVRGGFTTDTSGGGFPSFDNGRGLSGAEMFIGYGTDAASKYVLMRGEVGYSMGTHTVAGTADTVEYGQRGSGAFGANGAFTGGDVALRITGLSLSNAVPANADQEKEIEANGPIHNFATAHMYGAATDDTQVRYDKYADALDDYAQTYVGSKGVDLFAGSRFNDLIRSSGGSDVFDGRAGADTVELAGGIDGWTLSDKGGGLWTAAKGADTVSLANVELLKFDDKRFDLRTGEAIPLNYAPEDLAVSASGIAENAAAGTVIGTLSALDRDDDSFTWSLDAASAADFAITGNVLSVRTAFDHEAAPTRSVTVIATDAYGATTSKTLTIAVANEEEAPHTVKLSKASVAESSKVGTVVGTLSATDPEGKALTWALTDSAGGLFKLSGADLVLAKAVDYEKLKSDTVTVQATDAAGLKVTKTFTIGIADVNEAATEIKLSKASVAESSKAGTTIGTLSAVDPDGKALKWALTDSAGGLFKLSGDKLQLAKAVDYEKLKSDTVTVQATDAGGLKTTKTFTIGITDVNEAPHTVKLSASSVKENSKVGTTVGTLSAVDPEGKALTWKLTDSAGGLFKLSGTKLQTAKGIDYEKVQSDTVTVEAKDAGGLTVKKTFTIGITDAVETISGNGGPNKLTGGIGSDVLKGGAGNDILTGGGGADDLYGGTGIDTFRFAAPSHSNNAARDTIFDFEGKIGERIDLRDIDANGGAKGSPAFDFIGTAAYSGEAGELRVVATRSNTYLAGDTDGDKDSDFVVHFDGKVSILESYLLL